VETYTFRLVSICSFAEMCQIELNKLIKAEMITIDQDVLLKATPTGTAMAKYYLAFETMKLFTQVDR
jgi:hypothetical protein